MMILIHKISVSWIYEMNAYENSNYYWLFMYVKYWWHYPSKLLCINMTNSWVFMIVPIQTKRLVVDKYMEVDRFNEELVLLKKEMLSYIKYYTNNVLTSLRSQLKELDSKK